MAEPTDRIERCTEDDACFLSSIQVEFAIPIYMTQDQQRRLLDALDEIVKAPCNQLTEGLHWIAGMGSKPHFSLADAAFLGRAPEPDAPAAGEPTFDDSVFHVETCARDFGSAEERERTMRRREKEGKP